MDPLKGVQKIAVLLAGLGDEAAARVLAVFDEDEQERIGQAMVELEDENLGEEVVAAVVEEFKTMVKSGVGFRSHVGRTLQTVLNRLYGADEAAKRLSRIREESRSRHPFRPLQLLQAPDLARILRDEHPQLQALVLGNLEPEQAADVLRCMPEGDRPSVVERMATMEEPPPRLLKQVAQEIIERTRGLPRAEGRAPPDARMGVVADILNAAPEASKEILAKVDEEDQVLGTRIRERMFTWRDLGAFDKRTMQKVLAGIDTKVLAVALKASDQATTDAIFAATSQRTKDMILEEKDLLGSMALSEVLDAQRQILTVTRDLISSGEIAVNKGRGAAYVQ